MPVARDEPIGHASERPDRRQHQRRHDEWTTAMSKRGDDRPLGGQHLTVHTNPLESLSAALFIEAERLEIESLPRGHGRDTKPPIRETGRGRAEPAVTVEHEDRARTHESVPTTGWASRIRWSNPVS